MLERFLRLLIVLLAGAFIVSLVVLASGCAVPPAEGAPLSGTALPVLTQLPAEELPTYEEMLPTMDALATAAAAPTTGPLVLNPDYNGPLIQQTPLVLTPED